MGACHNKGSATYITKGRNAQGGSSDEKTEYKGEMTEAQMQAALGKELSEVDAKIDAFMKAPAGTDFELEDTYIEKHTVKDITKDYIEPYNDELKRSGNGFEYWDTDQVVHIKYKNGTQEYISPGEYDGTKRIKTTGIDSVIVSGGWGYAVAGKNIEVYNLRKTADYGKYGYKNLKQRYNDDNDIRVDFK